MDFHAAIVALFVGYVAGVFSCVAAVKVRRQCSWRDATAVAFGAGGHGTPEDEGP